MNNIIIHSVPDIIVEGNKLIKTNKQVFTWIEFKSSFSPTMLSSSRCEVKLATEHSFANPPKTPDGKDCNADKQLKTLQNPH